MRKKNQFLIYVTILFSTKEVMRTGYYFLFKIQINIMLIGIFILKKLLENGMIKTGEFYKGWKE
ncbi:hypothetical protein ABE29_16000 [Cytobacillus firmus]|nr:hypothetical protein [Cytobacillus firmus]MBG9550571.1 hypothetical protein [Cytobacillus firmus]MBG9554388.1 hypothetical protein [Cytobacillus firmus]MBG9558622.1 hypothetical protein [Cytobacillus firmus]MBG9577263.1 hypothetical protein [Cytobacillus firmus]